MKQKRAALYVRVSRDEQNTGSQERSLREYVERRDWAIYKIYRDRGVSGAAANRPALDELKRTAVVAQSTLSSFGSLTASRVRSKR